MITLKGVSKTYQTRTGVVQALHDINLNVAEGEIFGIIGPSGAGKSTLVHCINLLEQPTSGQVLIADQNLTTLSQKALRAARHKIGMIFQGFNLLSSKNVYQNVTLPLKLLGMTPARIKDKVLPLLEIVGLMDKQRNYPAQLSGGQKQRVAIARALACDPQVLLCDEATSSLDPKTTRTILDLLKDINQQFNLTILLITHEMSVIKKICDRVAVIHQGRIIESTDIISLFTHPQTHVARQLINAYLKHDLPADFKTLLSSQCTPDSHPVLQINYAGTATAEPVISRLVTEIGIDINILQANIEYVKNETIGMMTIELMGNSEKLTQVSAYLASHNVNVEILGYVTHTAD